MLENKLVTINWDCILYAASHLLAQHLSIPHQAAKDKIIEEALIFQELLEAREKAKEETLTLD